MVFRSGKYKGKDVDYVRRVAPWYIGWVRENRPEMLIPRKSKKVESEDVPEPMRQFSPLTPNLDFDNEPPMVMEEVKEVTQSFWD